MSNGGSDDDEDDDMAADQVEHDSLIREIAAAPAVPIAADLATLVLLEPGVLVDGSFLIEERLGVGGMGVVYAARDLKLDREVAIKLMRLERGIGELGHRLPEVFEREARATAKLNHPNIVTLHQFGDWNGLFYLVLERLHGETLHARMAREPVPLGDGLTIIEQVARALVHTHAAGITHRDLKPQNVFLTVDGTVKVLDFGVSGLVRSPSEPPPVRILGAVTWRSTLAHAGTPGYMAPEQWQGAPQSASTDLWAVGVMLYQLVSGALPFALEPLDELSRPAAPVTDLPAEASELTSLISRCLALRPDVRLADAGELAGALREIRGRLAAGAGHLAAGLPSLRSATRARRRRIAIIGAIAVVAGASALAGLPSPQGDKACSAAAARLAGVWDAESRARLAARFATERTGWSQLQRTLDIYTNQWTAMADAACRSESLPAQRCLDDRLAALQHLSSGIVALDILAAVGAARALPPLAECADPTSLALSSTTGRRDPASVAPLALTVAGRGLDIVHGAVFVDDDLVVVGFASPGAALAGVSVEPSDAKAERGGFAARVTRDGDVRWTRTLHDALPVAVARGRAGEVVIGGKYAGNGRIGAIELPELPTTTSGDCFVATLNGATGELTWVRTCHARRMAVLRGLATDPDGNVYASGEFAGAATFGGTQTFDAAARTESAPFVVSWGAGGQLRWGSTASGTVTSRTWGIAASGDAVVVAGKIVGGGSFGGRRLNEATCIITRLDPATGAVRWIRQEDGQGLGCTVEGIALHGERIAVGGRRLHAPGGAWIAELALSDGARRWVRQLGTDNHDLVKAFAFAPDGTLTVAGDYRTPSMTIDGVTMINRGFVGSYVLRLDAAGATLGAIGLSSAETVMSRWVVHAPDGRLAVGGRFTGGMTVGERELHGVGLNDGFLVELQATLTVPRQTTGAASP